MQVDLRMRRQKSVTLVVLWADRLLRAHDRSRKNSLTPQHGRGRVSLDVA
jgi:hypothetical protein